MLLLSKITLVSVVRLFIGVQICLLFLVFILVHRRPSLIQSEC